MEIIAYGQVEESYRHLKKAMLKIKMPEEKIPLFFVTAKLY